MSERAEIDCRVSLLDGKSGRNFEVSVKLPIVFLRRLNAAGSVIDVLTRRIDNFIYS